MTREPKNQGQNKLAKWYAERALFLVGKSKPECAVWVCACICVVYVAFGVVLAAAAATTICFVAGEKARSNDNNNKAEATPNEVY